MTAPKAIEPQIRSFNVDAMNTTFTIRMQHPDAAVAQSIAGSCFRQLEELESALSCFRPDSDVSRINALESGDSMLLSDVTYRCLTTALKAAEKTAGLFDPALGSQTQDEAVGPPDGGFALSPDRPQIICNEAGRKMDLGGIGKGFALEEMANTLRDLEVESALLSSGPSTHLAIGNRPWTLTLYGEDQTLDITLKSQAMSASGIGIQGAHIVHPDTGQPPIYHFKRIWVITDSAALADAFSTACLLMDNTETKSFARAVDNTCIYAEPVNSPTIRQL